MGIVWESPFGNSDQRWYFSVLGGLDHPVTLILDGTLMSLATISSAGLDLLLRARSSGPPAFAAGV
jgi:hypothetical protein